MVGFFLKLCYYIIMKITNIKVKNFRNYEDINLDINEDVNVFLGKNAQGKTNLLEAIFFCGVGKSFRTAKDKEVIKWNNESAKIILNIQKKYRKEKIEIIFSNKNKKTVIIDGISVRRIGDLLGELPVVFFSPDELKLIKESPEERRKFMNIDISQTNKRYFYLLSRYEKILANRNKLLKETKSLDVLKSTIDIWDKVLVEVAEKIIIEREKFIEEISPYAQKAHLYISNGKEVLKIKYKGFEKQKNEDYKTSLLKALQKNLEKDFKLGYTSIGPHRDDIDIYLNDIEVKSFGSQGQQRTTSLSLKLAELEIIKERTGEYPILLLDDVFSELDKERRERLIKFTTRTQTFITCTDFDLSGKNFKIFNIENGKIKKK